MGRKKQNMEEAQGAETMPERRPSRLYAMKSFRQITDKLKKMDLLTQEDRKAVEKINANLLNGYLISEENEEEEEDQQ